MRSVILGLGVSLALGASAMAQDAAVKLTRLHDALHLSAEQEDGWRDYKQAVAPTPEAMARRRATQQLLPSLPTPRRIALIDATMAQDLADLHRQGQAVVGFYMRLTPEQQRTFDHETSPTAGSNQGPSGAGDRALRMPPG